jgi:hypothetical protein
MMKFLVIYRGLLYITATSPTWGEIDP